MIIFIGCAAGIGLGLPIGLLLGAMCSESFREQVSQIPMGLRLPKTKKAKKHGVLNVRDFKDASDYFAILGQGARRNVKNAPSNLQKHGIILKTRKNTPWPLIREFVQVCSVIYSHEQRMYKPWMALLITWERWMCIAVMCGSLDEYWTNPPEPELPKLVAISHSIAKGNTLRGMWFYQREEYSRKGIWFHTIQLAVQRAVKLAEVNHVDIGPSKDGSDIAKVKEDYGFKMIDTWAEECDYAGPYRHLEQELGLVKSNGKSTSFISNRQ